MWVTCERCHTPIRDNDAEEHDGNRNRHAKACPPSVVEANVTNAIEAVIEGNEKECDIDRDEPRVLKKPPLDNFKREPSRRAHFRSEVLDPEVHDQ